MASKATYKGKVRDKNGYAVHLFYEYRGREYMVTDEHNGYSEPMYVKHKYEQERIDREIERESMPKKEYKYEDTAQYGFDLFWEYVNESIPAPGPTQTGGYKNDERSDFRAGQGKGQRDGSI